MEIKKRRSSTRTMVVFAYISVLIISLFACDDQKDGSSAHSGKLRLSLNADTTSLKKGVNSNLTKAVADEFEQFLTVEDYKIQILTEKDTVKSYDRFDQLPSEIELPEGAYTIVASKGNDLPAEFENPYFEGSTAFTIKEGMSTPLDVTCTLGNARITAEYTDDFKEAYSEYTVLLSSSYTSTDLEIAKGETRPAYLQVAKEGTDVAIGIRLKKINAEEEKTYYVPTALKLERRQNVRLVFKTDGEALEGIGLDIVLDDTLEEKTFTEKIPDFMWQQFTKPTLSADGFKDGDELTVKISEFNKDLSVGFGMPGGIESLVVKQWIGDGEDNAEYIDLVTDAELAKERNFSWMVGDEENPALKEVRKTGYLNLKNAIKSLKAPEEGSLIYHYQFYGTDVTGKHNETNVLNLTVIVKAAGEPFIKDFILPAEIVEGDALKAVVSTKLIAEASIDAVKTVLTIQTQNGETRSYTLMDKSEDTDLSAIGVTVETSTTTELDITFDENFTTFLLAPVEGGSTSYDVILHLEDENGRIEEVIKTILVKAPVLQMSSTEGDAFAKRIVLRANLSEEANRKYIGFQYKLASESVWRMVESSGLKSAGKALDGFIQYVDTLTGLVPSSSYLVRAIYNQERYSEPINLETEEDLAIEGGDLDAWTRTKVDEGGASLLSTEGVVIYNYENESTYWRTNNSFTMPDVFKPKSSIAYRCFPMVSYIVNKDGKAAAVRSIGAQNGNSEVLCDNDSRHRGMLYLGSTNGEGMSFASRPFGLKFEYKYEPYNSEPFEIYAVVKNGDTILGKVHYTDNTAQSNFKEIVIPFDYTNFTQKAEKIYLYFYSSTKEQPSVAKKVSIEMENGTYTVHAGSCLYIDNVELTY